MLILMNNAYLKKKLTLTFPRGSGVREIVKQSISTYCPALGFLLYFSGLISKTDYFYILIVIKVSIKYLST